ncbi:MAG: leucine-rich repeat domain-containing protein [Lachnospiraceae bacterium]|nr:leucine-rich repeat domain-containing protein [Lachnospiraceae bacterium]
MSERKEEYMYHFPRPDRVREVEEAWKACGTHPQYGKRKIFFIGGKAGVGKTWLAREVAMEYLKGRQAGFKEACLMAEPEILPVNKRFDDTYEQFCDKYDKLVFYNEPGTLPGMGRFVKHDQNFMTVGAGYLLVVHVNYDLRDGDWEAFAKLREYLQIYQDHVRSNGTILVTVRWTKPAEDIYILEEGPEFVKKRYEDPAGINFTDRQIEVLRFLGMFPECWIHTDTISRGLQMEAGEISDLLCLLENHGYVEWNPASVMSEEKGETAALLERSGEIKVNREAAEILLQVVNGQKGGEAKDFVAEVFGNLMNLSSGEQLRELDYLLKLLMRRLGAAEAIVYYAACERVAEFELEKLAVYEGIASTEDMPECLLVRVQLPDGAFYGLHGLQDADGRWRHDLSTLESIKEGDILCKTKGLTLEAIHKAGGAVKIEYVALLCGRKEKTVFRQPEQLGGCRESSIADEFTHGVWTKLVSVQFAEGLRSIGAWAFGGCSEVCGELRLPDGLREIGDHAFSNCSGFRGNLIIPESVVRIGTFAFSGGKFDGKLVLRNEQVEVGENAFSGCDSLEK